MRHSVFLSISDQSNLSCTVTPSQIRMEDLSTLGIFALTSEWPENSEEKSTDVVQLALDAAGAFLQSPATSSSHQMEPNTDLDSSYTSGGDRFIFNNCDNEQSTNNHQEDVAG